MFRLIHSFMFPAPYFCFEETFLFTLHKNSSRSTVRWVVIYDTRDPRFESNYQHNAKTQILLTVRRQKLGADNDPSQWILQLISNLWRSIIQLSTLSAN